MGKYCERGRFRAQDLEFRLGMVELRSFALEDS